MKRMCHKDSKQPQKPFYHLLCNMNRKTIILMLLLCCQQAFAQPVLMEVLKPNRDKLFRNIVRNTINSNLSLPLTDSTEDKWEDAFRAIEMLYYRSPWIDKKINLAFNDLPNRSATFQRALLEVGYAVYPGTFNAQAGLLLQQTTEAKIFAMCATYLLKTDSTQSFKNSVYKMATDKLSEDAGNPILEQLIYQVVNAGKPTITPSVHTFLQNKYLNGHVLVISFQRTNRNYPGLALVRDAKGNFIKDDAGNIFSVPQLARSISALPGYLTNGNTPEGIFRMYGFDHSKSIFIGPTTNIQLSMPFENKASHFFDNAAISDDDWSINRYKSLLPENFRNHYPALQSYFAGMAGRTEIIAHGTTVDPAYYKGKSYYPLTPTQGCLCTKEIWDESNGKLLESDQQKLADAVSKAGGPYGYAIVINLDDSQQNVTMEDILPFLKLAGRL